MATSPRSKFRRAQIPTTGSFVAVPRALPGVDRSVETAIKIECVTYLDSDFWTRTYFSTDKVLVDLASVDPAKLDVRKAIADCEHLITVLRQNPTVAQKALALMQSGGSAKATEAAELLNSAGLDEASFIRAGGGLIFLVIVVAVAAGGCFGTCGKPPVKRPEAPTPDAPPADAPPADAPQ